MWRGYTGSRARQLILLFAVAGALAAAPFDVTGLGARGDGRTLDTAAIRKAIDLAHGAGGGVVYFPPGRFLTGTIRLKSNVTIHLSPGATLLGSPRPEHYEPRHLIYARGADNIAIQGGGVIDGNGTAFWISSHERPEFRPSPLIELAECRNVRFQNIRILNAPGWALHPILCDDVTIRGVTIIAPMLWLNTDGIDPDSCRNVRISDCYIRAGDDCIVLKTTGRLGLPAPPCENVTVTNCVFVSSASALKLGTESHGDFRNIQFSNSVIRGSRTGLALLAKDGGVMENVHFSNITIETHPKHNRDVEWPIVIDVEKRNAKSRLSKVRDVSFSDIQIRTRGRVLAAGMPASPLERLRFVHVTVRVEGCEEIESASKLRGGTVEKLEDVVDLGPVPAAMIFGHIRGLTLEGVRVFWDAPKTPLRHTIYGCLIDGLVIDGFSVRRPPGGEELAVIGLDQVRDIRITGSRAAPGTAAFVGLRDVPASDLSLAENDLRHARQERREGAVYLHSR